MKHLRLSRNSLYHYDSLSELLRASSRESRSNRMMEPDGSQQKMRQSLRCLSVEWMHFNSSLMCLTMSGQVGPEVLACLVEKHIKY